MYYGFNYGYSNPYDFYTTPSTVPTVWSYFGFVVLVFSMLFIGLALSGACYILKSYSLYRLGCRRKMKSTFFAFFPVANNYFLGKIADDINRTMNRRTNYAQKILLLSIVSIIIACVWLPLAALTMLLASNGFFVAVLWVLLTLVFLAVYVTGLVYYFIALNTVYKEYAHKNAVLFTIISVVVSVASSVFLFTIRNRKSGYELWLEQREEEARREKEAQQPIIVFSTDVGPAEQNETVTMTENETVTVSENETVTMTENETVTMSDDEETTEQ